MAEEIKEVSVEDILKMAEGAPVAEKPTEEAPDSDIPLGDAEDQPSDETPETPDVEEPEQPVVAKKRNANERIRELNAKAKAAQEEAAATKARLAFIEEQNQQLINAMKKLTGDDVSHEAPKPKGGFNVDDAVDPEATSHLQGEINALKGELAVNNFTRAVTEADQLGRAQFEDYDTATNYVLATEANRIMLAAKATGREVNESQAVQMASQQLGRDLVELFSDGATAKNLSFYVYNRALAAGFKVTKHETKPNVDMKAVQRARDEAGAPAIERASANPFAGKKWTDDIYNSAKENGYSADYVNQALGLK